MSCWPDDVTDEELLAATCDSEIAADDAILGKKHEEDDAGK